MTDDRSKLASSFERHTEAGPASIDAWRVEGVTVVAVKGELDASNVHVLRRLIGDSMRDGAHELVLDFTDTGYIDSSATALVASLAADMRAKRTKLAVVAPSGSPTRRVFEVSGLAGEVDLREVREQTPPPSD